MNKTNKDIKDQYEFFTELLNSEKIISNTTIQLLPKKNNARWLSGSSSVQHPTISDDVTLSVERSKRDSKYGIKLRCSALTKEPFFRFDSDGPAHRNDELDIPLEEQSISTPHFNSFNQKGKPIAYKTDTLRKENDAKAIVADINFGVSLFCMESKLKLKNGTFPVVSDVVPEIEFEKVQNVNFDQINFE